MHDDELGTDATGDGGLVIVLGAAQVGDDFEATWDGVVLATETTASTGSAIFTLVITAL